MLSWASYLFGSGQSSEPQEDVSPKTDDQVAMDTEERTLSDQDWVVVEHTGNHEAPRVGITDLENLLIEHPSMSVYKRSGSEGEESNMSESSSNELVPAKSKRSQAMSRQAPKRARAVSARAQILAQVSQVKHAQKLQQKQSSKKQSKKNLERANKSAIKDKHVSRKNKVRNPSGRMNGRVPQRKQ